MFIDDLDIMELDDVVGISAKTTDFDYNLDFAFDVYSQEKVNYNGRGEYLLNH